MQCTTLGYICQNDKMLMIHRTKKEVDISKDKWLGLGGRIEEGESPLEAMIRECREESGLAWLDPRLFSVVTFNYRKTQEDPLYCEQMFLFTGNQIKGEMIECNEGDLEWVSWEKLSRLNIWKGDRIFLSLLKSQAPFFFLRLDYTGNQLDQAFLNDQKIDLDRLDELFPL